MSTGSRHIHTGPRHIIADQEHFTEKICGSDRVSEGLGLEKDKKCNWKIKTIKKGDLQKKADLRKKKDIKKIFKYHHESLYI